VLLIRCPDQRGLVARTAEFVAHRGGNLVHAEHHIDRSTGLFLMRLEWELDGFEVAREAIAAAFTPLAEAVGATWELHFSDQRRRVAIWVTREGHCLSDLLQRQATGELRCEIAFVLGNRDDLATVAQAAGVAFHHVPAVASTRAQAVARQLALLREHGVDLVVLAKYMQVLSADLLARCGPVINIHHSFLPAFVGANPYRQAHERGVKVIGATAHYATADLDCGPIIEQDTAPISHRDALDDIIRKGRDLERVVLARAVRSHLLDRVIVHGNRTSVFE